MTTMDKRAYSSTINCLEAWLSLEEYEGTTAVRAAFTNVDGTEAEHDYAWKREMIDVVKADRDADKPFDYGGEAPKDWFRYMRKSTAKAKLALIFAKAERNSK